MTVQFGIDAFRLHSRSIRIARTIAGTAIIVAVTIAAVRAFFSFVIDQQTLLFRRVVGIFPSVNDGGHSVIRQIYDDTVPNGGEAENEFAMRGV